MPKDLHSEEVTYTVDDIPVYATLTRPEHKGPGPAVVFVAGSGPTDRDWCTPLLPGMNGSGRLLAEALTREGFVTLRYDKRFSGPHAMENLPKMMGKISMQAHTDELAGAVKLLAADNEVDPDRVFVLSSSEGAIHALHYQLQATGRKFHGMVLTGAPGRSIADVARSQISAQVAGLPDSDTLMQHFDAAVADFIAGRPVTPDPALPEGARLLLASLATPANQPFSRELWSANPAGLLPRITVPGPGRDRKEGYPGGLAGRRKAPGGCHPRSRQRDLCLPGAGEPRAQARGCTPGIARPRRSRRELQHGRSRPRPGDLEYHPELAEGTRVKDP